MRLRGTLVALTALVALAAPAGAQDVELLSEIHGTPLPPGYRAWREAHPDAFRFAHGRAARMRVLARTMQLRGGAPSGPLAALGPRDGAVIGTYHIPVVLGLFSDSPDGSVPIERDVIQEAYFGSGPNTIRAYYSEVSGGRLTLEGDVQDWVRGSLTQAVVTGGTSGLTSPARVGDFIVSLLDSLPPMDWGAFDNDGPDGVPNSGDDDGYVDALAVIQPTSGAECGGAQKANRIWSHKWSLSSATSTRSAYVTSTPAANGDFIRVDDYFIQPALSCSGVQLNEIGVFTHEAGHAFGLPDLYDTYDGDGKTAGDGNWDLMATGSWGCDNRTPSTPCHLGAWSKAMLGWADVVTLGPDTDLGTLALPPVESSGTVYRVDAEDGSGEYYLLENRQRIGFDRNVLGTGMLVWQINPQIVASRWPGNVVNAYSDLGVWIRQADGLAQLETPGGGRGDSGDPFPFTNVSPGNHVFHAASNPPSRSKQGTATGLTLLDIERVGQDVSFRALTRFTRVTVASEGDAGAGGLLTVDGALIPEPTYTYQSVPFEAHSVSAAAGEALEDGVRRPFVGWVDDPSAPRVRTVDTPVEDVTLTARYQGRELELSVDLNGGVNGVPPGTVRSDPAGEGLWFDEGATVTVEAVPRTGFGFLRWTGALEGQPNPATVTMDAPKQAGADFEITYAFAPTSLTIPAAESGTRQLAPENGNAPYTWTLLAGTLPEGLNLEADGRLMGAATVTGTFPLQLRVRDSIGLTAEGTLALQVVAPVLTVAALASPFLLTGPALTAEQERFLDRQGNQDANYDLGDFRAWVLANPGLPLSAEVRALVGADAPLPGPRGEAKR